MMAPSSARRTRTRREAGIDNTQEDDPPPKPSPGRPSPKKRKIASGNPQQSMHTFETISKLSSEQLQMMVIPKLALPDHDVVVAREECNEKIAQRTKGAQISAFARIAGPSWTVYMREERLVVGRSPDIVKSSEANGPITSPALEEQVHIDLGPNKIVSRQHAVIEFGNSWQLTVSGRNGAKVDETRVDRGSSAPLHAGSVIEIGGCQMLFLLPEDGEFHIARSVLESLHLIEKSHDSDPGQVSEKLKPPRPTEETISADLANLKAHSSIASESNVPLRPTTPPPPVPPFPQELRSPQNASRGMALETMEAIDYSLESMKEFKPPHSYAMLIGLAILSADGQQLSLAAIYQWIKDRFAYFRHAHPGWQNSIRHNLSLNKYFNKVPRRTDEPGKGMKWTINDADRAEFIEKHIKQPHRNGRPNSSGPNTPSAETSHRPLNEAAMRLGGPAIKSEDPLNAVAPSSDPRLLAYDRPGRGMTPPPYSLSGVQKLAYTPDRGPRNVTQFSRSPGASQHPANPYYLHPSPGSPGPGRPALNAFTQSQPIFHSDSSLPAFGAASPGRAMLTSASPYVDEHPFNINNMLTPAPRKQQPALPPPSTLRMPSSFMLPASSPAPFWKFMSDTPSQFSPAGFSPQKPLPGSRLEVQSSSPPPPDEQRRDLGSPVKVGASQGSQQENRADLKPENAPTQPLANGVKGPGLGISQAETRAPPLEEDFEGGGIDLAKPWQTIGQYHEKLSRQSNMATAK